MVSYLHMAAGGYGSCRSDEFMCSHPRRCITQRWVCDLDRDCEDGSDETDCRMCLPLSMFVDCRSVLPVARRSFCRRVAIPKLIL